MYSTYMCVARACVCVCDLVLARVSKITPWYPHTSQLTTRSHRNSYTDSHTHRYIYIYTHVYIDTKRDIYREKERASERGGERERERERVKMDERIHSMHASLSISCTDKSVTRPRTMIYRESNREGGAAGLRYANESTT